MLTKLIMVSTLMVDFPTCLVSSINDVSFSAQIQFDISIATLIIISVLSKLARIKFIILIGKLNSLNIYNVWIAN